MHQRVTHDAKQLVVDNLVLFTERGHLHWCLVSPALQVYVTQLDTPVGHLFVYVQAGPVTGLALAVEDWTNVIYVNKCKCLDALVAAIRKAIAAQMPSMLPKLDESWPQNIDQALFILETFRRLTAR